MFGESGGGVRTCAHLTAPGSAGLFDKAIMQSGGCSMSWPVQMMPYGSFWAPAADVKPRGRAYPMLDDPTGSTVHPATPIGTLA